MELIPSYDLFYNSGRIRVVKVDPLEDINGTAKEWAVSSGNLGEGNDGQSVGGIMSDWKDHTVKEKRRTGFANFVKMSLWGLLGLIVSVSVIFICTKLVALWMVKKRINRAMKAIRDVVGESEAISGRVTEALSHVSRLTHLVRRRAGFGPADDPDTEFENVELGDLRMPDVPAPTQSCSCRSDPKNKRKGEGKGFERVMVM